MRLLWITAWTIAAVTIAGMWASEVFAQGRNCGDRAVIIERLAERYGEARVLSGLTQTNGVLEFFGNAESGSWTVLITMPNGMTCLVAAGEAFTLSDGPEPTPPV